MSVSHTSQLLAHYTVLIVIRSFCFVPPSPTLHSCLLPKAAIPIHFIVFLVWFVFMGCAWLVCMCFLTSLTLFCFIHSSCCVWAIQFISLFTLLHSVCPSQMAYLPQQQVPQGLPWQPLVWSTMGSCRTLVGASLTHVVLLGVSEKASLPSIDCCPHEKPNKQKTKKMCLAK